MESRFFSRPIKVTTDEDSTNPRLFHFDGKNYVVTEMLESWPDNGFGNSRAGQRKWWQRRHRKYFRVLTESNEVFEIYYDRGIGKTSPPARKWYITRRIVSQ